MQSEAGYQNSVSHNSGRKILSDSRTQASFFQPIQYTFHQMKINSVSNMEMGLLWISTGVQYNADPLPYNLSEKTIPDTLCRWR